MTNLSDLLLSARDAEAIASVERLPENLVAMNSRVTYREGRDGPTRTIVIVHPREADPGAGRISVLSPVARALLGHAPGDTASAEMPNGRTIALAVLETERGAEEPR